MSDERDKRTDGQPKTSLSPLDKGRAREVGSKWLNCISGINPMPRDTVERFLEENPSLFNFLGRFTPAINGKYEITGVKLVVGACLATYELISMRAQEIGQRMPVVTEQDISDVNKESFSKFRQMAGGTNKVALNPMFLENLAYSKREEISEADAALLEISEVFGSQLLPEHKNDHEGAMFKGVLNLNILTTYSLLKTAFERENTTSIFPLDAKIAHGVVMDWLKVLNTFDIGNRSRVSKKLDKENGDLVKHIDTFCLDFRDDEQAGIMARITTELVHSLISEVAEASKVEVDRVEQQDIDRVTNFFDSMLPISRSDAVGIPYEVVRQERKAFKDALFKLDPFTEIIFQELYENFDDPNMPSPSKVDDEDERRHHLYACIALPYLALRFAHDRVHGKK